MFKSWILSLIGLGSRRWPRRSRPRRSRIAVAGPVASIGEQMKRGAETAAAAINDAGGVSANPEMAARPPVRTRNLVEEP